MITPSSPGTGPSSARQRGQGLFLAVLLLVLGVSALIYSFASPGKINLERDRVTTEALAQAKAALIGYAVSMNDTDLTGGARPGDLPCPDANDDGAPDAPCDTQASRVGRLPWKSLGLADLRDGDGERLWYAVSTNFKSSTRTACASPGVTGCLNSDTRGTITVRNSNGAVVNDGTDAYGSLNPSGVIAVIFAPGAVLHRQGAGSEQIRGCTGGSCTAAGVCNSAPVTNTPKCNPVNYLDVVGPPVLTVIGATGSTEDNADFVDGVSTANGFIQGPIRDGTNNVIMNDRLITITYNDLMPLVQRRVAKEVLNCLTQYAAVPQNRGRYPWAAPITDTTPPYRDQANARFGRIPDTFPDTLLGLGGLLAAAVCPLPLVGPLLCMTTSWPLACGITQGTWWTNWKEMVFYGVAEAYQPGDPTGSVLFPAAISAGGPCGNCLTVNPPSGADDKRVVVVVAGSRLTGQSRVSVANKGFPPNYLEDLNGDPASPYTTQDIYTQQPTTSTFNDVVVYQ